MIIDSKNKQMQMEPRDLNYILPAYMRAYLFYTKNEMPERIVFPMLSSVPFGNIQVTIEWVPEISPVVAEIAKDGSNVPEITPEAEAVLDEKDEEIRSLKEQLAGLKTEAEHRGGEGMRSIEGGVQSETLAKPDAPEAQSVAKPAQSKAKTAFSAPVDRKPRLPPGGDIGPGLSPSDMHSRDRRDLNRTKSDLAEGPDIDETAEVPFEKAVKRDNKGNPVVEG